jgi:molybdate-binding protein
MGRVALAEVGGRWVSFGLSGSVSAQSADGLVTSVERHAVRVELLRPASEAQGNLVVMGCAPALGLIAQRLNAGAGQGRCVWIGGSSTVALEAFDRAQVHLAGVHLTDKNGRFNSVDVRRKVRTSDHELISLARWQVGFVVAAGNPRQIRGPEDLGQRGLRWVVREPGSGARRLWDRLLVECGLAGPSDGQHRPRNGAGQAASSQVLEARGQLELAHAVSLGAADVGIATLDAALAFGLRFIPVAEERYDIVVRSAQLEDSRVGRWFDLITSAALGRELRAVGYDVSCAGERVVGQAA